MERITRRVSCLTLLKQNTFLDMHVHYILQLAYKSCENKGEYLIFISGILHEWMLLSCEN